MRTSYRCERFVLTACGNNARLITPKSPVAHQGGNGGWNIRLDGALLLLPAGHESTRLTEKVAIALIISGLPVRLRRESPGARLRLIAPATATATSTTPAELLSRGVRGPRSKTPGFTLGRLGSMRDG
jgi:hypothetical protein